MNVLQNLMELYNQLPLDSTYRVVVRGILENMDAAADATIYDIAELTDSSRTTVWRMVQKMGYKNYSDFRYALKSAVSQYTYYNRVIPAQKATDPMTIFHECAYQLKTAAKLFEKNFVQKDILDIAQKIHDVKHVRFYLYSRSYAVYSFQQNLSMDGKDTGYCCLLPDMEQDVKTLDESSVLFINSIEFSETMDLSAVFSAARKQGCHIILANMGKSRYESMADCVLFKSVDFSDSMGVASNTIFETYIIMLSEIYRRNYLEV